MSSNALLDSLRAAVAAAPHDVALRLHLGEVLLGAGLREEAVRQAATVLADHPGDGDALALLTAASTSADAPARARAPVRPASGPVLAPDPAGASGAEHDGADAADDAVRRWSAELAEDARARYIEGDDGMVDVQAAGLRLADVAGMDEVKARLEAGFLAPMRNPALAKAYGATMSGGMLMYGPPGCGETFIARAVAGEVGAAFIPVMLSDVLDMYVGGSERNVHELFETARASAPCVVFLDEVDAGRGTQQVSASPTAAPERAPHSGSYPVATTQAAVTATPDQPVTLHLASDFASGHTTLAWQPDGAPLVTWDFVVEID